MKIDSNIAVKREGNGKKSSRLLYIQTIKQYLRMLSIYYQLASGGIAQTKLSYTNIHIRKREVLWFSVGMGGGGVT
jgi:hypothetical protein